MKQYVFNIWVEGIDVPVTMIGKANNEGCARENAKRELIKKCNKDVNIIKMKVIDIIK